MTIKDRGLGIDLITLRDLMGEEPSAALLDGATVQPSLYRARAERFADTGKVKDRVVVGLSGIKFWIVLDCGEDKKTPRQADAMAI